MFGLEKPWMKGCWELWWQWEEMIHFSWFLEKIDYAGSEREKMHLNCFVNSLGQVSKSVWYLWCSNLLFSSCNFKSGEHFYIKHIQSAISIVFFFFALFESINHTDPLHLSKKDFTVCRVECLGPSLAPATEVHSPSLLTYHITGEEMDGSAKILAV